MVRDEAGSTPPEPAGLADTTDRAPELCADRMDRLRHRCSPLDRGFAKYVPFVPDSTIHAADAVPSDCVLYSYLDSRLVPLNCFPQTIFLLDLRSQRCCRIVWVSSGSAQQQACSSIRTVRQIISREKTDYRRTLSVRRRSPGRERSGEGACVYRP